MLAGDRVVPRRDWCNRHIIREGNLDAGPLGCLDGGNDGSKVFALLFVLTQVLILGLNTGDLGWLGVTDGEIKCSSQQFDMAWVWLVEQTLRAYTNDAVQHAHLLSIRGIVS